MKKGYSLGLLTMSVMVSCPTIAAAYSRVPASLPAQTSDAKTGIHFDIGVQANAEYSTVKYSQDRYKHEAIGGAMSDVLELHPMEVHRGPFFSPTVFAGLRYYRGKSFIGFHVGDTFTHRKLFTFEVKDQYSFSDPIHDVQSTLTSTNTLYGKLFWGYFITPKTDINISALGVYDWYKLNYKVDAYKTTGDFIDSLPYEKKFGASGYGVGLGAERYLSDHIIVSLNYTFIQHSSKSHTFEAVRFDNSGGLLDDYRERFDFRTMQENVISLGLMVEV